jgi:hypothetical protein
MRKHRSNKERGGPLERRFSLEEEEASSTATAHFENRDGLRSFVTPLAPSTYKIHTKTEKGGSLVPSAPSRHIDTWMNKSIYLLMLS